MMVSDAHRYVYVAVPKTGGRSMRRALKGFYGGRALRSGMHQRAIPKTCIDYLIFCTVRNPYDRAVSKWWATTQRGHDKLGLRKQLSDPDSFECFALNLVGGRLGNGAPPQFWINQLDFVRGITRWPDLILRFERMNEQVHHLPFWTDEKLPHVNRTDRDREPWPYYYTEAAKQAIQEFAADDFTWFGYSRDVPTPEAVAA